MYIELVISIPTITSMNMKEKDNYNVIECNNSVYYTQIKMKSQKNSRECETPNVLFAYAYKKEHQSSQELRINATLCEVACEQLGFEDRYCEDLADSCVIRITNKAIISVTVVMYVVQI